MRKKSSVYKSFALITQMGINVMVPTFLCLFIGIWVGKLIGTWAVIPFLFLGMAAGMRNCYVMAMNASGGRTSDTPPATAVKGEVLEDGQHDEDC